LNLAIGGGFFNGYSALTSADVAAWSSTSYSIDYVRVYKRSTGSTSASGTSGSGSTSGTSGSTTSQNTGNTDIVILSRAPNAIVGNSVFQVTVSYVAPESRDIVVDILDSQTYAWYGKGIVNVPAGKGSVVVTINGVNSPVTGNNYQLKAWNVPKGVAGTTDDWKKAIDLDYKTISVGSSLVYSDSC
jgi:hypothetical protein